MAVVGRVIIAIDGDSVRARRMVSLRESIGNGVRSVYCALAGPAAVGLSGLGNIYRGLGADRNGDDLVDSANLLRAGQQIACNRPPSDISDDIAPLFNNGQCPDTEYEVQIDFTPSGESQFTFTNDIWGPIGSASVVEGRPGVAPESGRWIIEVRGGTIPSGRPGAGEQEIWRAIPFLSPLSGPPPSIDAQRVTPLRGGDDSCGGPGPVIPPYNPGDWTAPLPLTFDDNGGGQTTINPDITFGPSERGPGVEVTVPFEIDFGDGISVGGDFNLDTGDIELDFGGDGGAGTPGGEGEPTGEESGAIFAVRFVASFDEADIDASTVTQDAGYGDLFVPRLGYISFAYDYGSGLVYGPELSIKTREGIVFTQYPAVSFTVHSESGVTVQSFPIYAPSEGVCFC